MTIIVKEPARCSQEELDRFENLVRQGGEVTEAGLGGRIHRAKGLALGYSDAGSLVAVAALKVPNTSYRDRVFKQEGTSERSSDYPFEFGWVFVIPDHRGHRLSEQLGRKLLALTPDTRTFATVRTDNAPMLNVLSALAFRKTGSQYPSHALDHHELLLLVRSR